MLNHLIKLQYGRLTFSVMGDSISDPAGSNWTNLLAVAYNSGLCAVLNHALSGHSVIGNMDAQTNLSEVDRADFTLILLGVNDPNPLDPTFQTVYGDNLIELFGTTGKPIYAMGTLNNTFEDGVVRNAKNVKISNAVADAVAAGVNATYWNTDGWIDPAIDTADGLHPNAGGHAKIVIEIMALLPAWVAPAQKYLQTETAGIEVFA